MKPEKVPYVHILSMVVRHRVLTTVKAYPKFGLLLIHPSYLRKYILWILLLYLLVVPDEIVVSHNVSRLLIVYQVLVSMESDTFMPKYYTW